MSLEAVRLRNVMTGEVRDVVSQSDEYVDLINQVYDHSGSARPKWEVTGEHHVRRVDNGEIQEEDLGYAFKPIPGAEVGLDEIGPELHPERALTEAEVEAGIESYDQKISDLGFRPSQQNREVESLEEIPAEEREERGREAAGSASSSKRGSGNGSRSGRRGGNGGGSGSGSGGGSSSASGSSAGAGAPASGGGNA